MHEPARQERGAGIAWRGVTVFPGDVRYVRSAARWKLLHVLVVQGVDGNNQNSVETTGQNQTFQDIGVMQITYGGQKKTA